MNTTREEKKAKAELIDKCAVYLNENFHKFSQTNKIKIALEIFKRDMPDKNEHSGEIKLTAMGLITIDAKPIEINIG